MIVHRRWGARPPRSSTARSNRRISSQPAAGPHFDLHWLTTNIDEKDWSTRADKLRFAIKEAERRHSPKAILRARLLHPASSARTSKDSERGAEEVNATIVPVHCEGIRSRIIQTAYDAFWHGVPSSIW